MNQWIWPEIDEMDDAKRASYNGAATAFLIASITGIITFLQTNGMISLFKGLSKDAYLDVGVFVLLGAGLCFKSRIAALIALVLYSAEQYFMIKNYGVRFSLVAIYFILNFINAVRGTFAYHRFKKQIKSTPPQGSGLQIPVPGVFSQAAQNAAASEAIPQTQGTAEQTSVKKKKRPVFVILLWITLLVAGMAGLGTLVFLKPEWRQKIQEMLKQPKGEKDTRKENLVSRAVSLPDFPKTDNSAVKAFKMKSGKVIKGKIVTDDPVYYNVETSFGGQEVVIKEDIESVQ